MAQYAFGKPVSMPFDQAVEKITAALAQQGFGILSDIDVSATLKKKLGLAVPPYRILGACNPKFASEALAAEPQIGALLPCNVVVRQDAGGTTHVEFMDPRAVLSLVDHPKVHELADQVRTRLSQALSELA